MAGVFGDHLIHHISHFYPPALQERYGKEARRSPPASEGQGDPLGGPAPAVPAPMPLAEVELKWEMEKEEKRLLWEQLQGLEVNLGLLGLGCQEAGRCCSSACGPTEMSVTSPPQWVDGLGRQEGREGTGLTSPLLIRTPSLILSCRA